jgi:iron complex outermembrane recepter protein
MAVVIFVSGRMNCLLRSSVIALAALVATAHGQSPTPAPATLDTIVVSATPLNRTLFEQASPVSVLTGETLRLQLAPTLGETLSGTPGVSSSYFGPAASRPVIRGLDADRIRVLQNGVNTIDASATSADHAVSFQPVVVESIEVVRGPATLLYGPNAIGGLINVVDRRIPLERIDVPVRGSVEGKYGSVNTERGGAFTLEGGLGRFAWHIEGYKTATDDLHIPGYARSARLRARDPLPDGEKEQRDVLLNSNLRTEGLSGGASYIWDKGFLGAAFSGFNSNYGTVAERDVTIDLQQRRFDVRGAFFDPLPIIKAINYKFAYSNYEHTEFEGPAVGTVFENEGYDGRLEITHAKLGPFEGTIGYQSEKSDFSATGEEAFIPPVETLTNSAFIFEEVGLGSIKLQGGVRYDHITTDSSTAVNFGPGRSRTFDNLSGSLGLVWTPAPDYAVALSGSYSERAPTYQELYANGPHVATNAFEIGNPNLGVEKALGVDLTFRKKAGRVTGALSLFYTRFNDFIGEFATGESVAGEEDELPVFAFRTTDAEFWGGELETTIRLFGDLVGAAGPVGAPTKNAVELEQSTNPHSLDLILKADYVHARDTVTGDPLPRIPPFRASAALAYSYARFGARIEGQYAAEQNRTSEFELPTDSYFLLNASVDYHFGTGPVQWDAYVRGTNLTNEEARLHTSFLKDIAPLGGASITVGLKASF